MEKYYGILMNKVEIQENIVVYIPERIIPGVLSDVLNDENSQKVFVEESYGKDYLLMDDYLSIFPPDDKVVGYVISEEDLLLQADGLSLEQAQIEYFDTNSETLKIGFYIPEKFDDKIIFCDFNLEKLKSELSCSEVNEEGEISTSYFDIISSLIGFDNLVKVEENETSGITEKIDFKKITLSKEEKTGTIEEVKEKVLEKYQQQDEETFEMLLNKLELLSPKDIVKYDDIEVIKAKLDSAITICNKMKNIIEEKCNEKVSKTVILRMLESIESYYTNQTRLEKVENIKLLLNEFNFVHEKSISLLKEYDYDEVLSSKEALELRQRIMVPDPKKHSTKEKKINFDEPFSIEEVKNACDKVVIGQEEAKEAVISSIYMNRQGGNSLTKNTCLLVGPTGSGKTLIVETVADYLDIPSVSIDTTQLTIAGYKGADIENFLATLIHKADGNVKKAEHGIVILDEFDKKGSDNNSDSSGKGVLNSLLPFIQGTLYKVSMGKGINEKIIDFNTHNLTVLIAGSCADAIKEVEKQQKKTIGFKANKDEEQTAPGFCKLTKEDIEEYCKIPSEFMGRISNLVQLQPHTKDTIRQIILESKISPLLAEKEKLNNSKIELSWNDEYIEKLGEKTLEDTHGVRALKGFIETSIMPARWKALKQKTFNKIILNEKSVEDPLETVLVYQDGNYTTVKELNEKEQKEKEKTKEKSNDKK